MVKKLLRIKKHFCHLSIYLQCMKEIFLLLNVDGINVKCCRYQWTIVVNRVCHYIIILSIKYFQKYCIIQGHFIFIVLKKKKVKYILWKSYHNFILLWIFFSLFLSSSFFQWIWSLSIKKWIISLLSVNRR